MNNIVNTAKNIGFKAFTKIKKVSPEILLGVGTVSIIGGVVLLCRSMKKVDDSVENFKEVRTVIKSTEVGTEVTDSEGNKLIYSEKDKREDTGKLYLNTAKEIGKAVAPGVGLLTGGFACIFSSYGIMRARGAKVLAAYTALSSAFDSYKKRVAEELGPEKERDIRLGIKEIEQEEKVVDDKGKEKTKKKKVRTQTDLINSPYARCFDEYNDNWRKDNALNKTFLLQAQNWANELYNARGHIFLNEVYDILGFDRTSAGAVVGWVKGKGDNYVTFGIEDGVMEANRLFINGQEPSIWLDFNVDGVILDYI